MNSNGPQYDTDQRDLHNQLPDEEIQDIEDQRVAELEAAGIDESAVIAEIHQNMNSWTEYFSENNTKGTEDIQFLYQDQWTSIEKSEFDRQFKPSLVINKLYDPVRKVIGEQRDNTPEIKVRSLTGKASQDAVNLNSDMLKRISYSSDAKVVYQNAFQSAITFSYGGILLDLEYESSDSFNQDIKYKSLEEPEKCFWDPRAKQCHKGDGNFFGYYIDISNEEYDARYPNIPHPTSFSDAQSLTQFQWFTKDSVVICDYWVKEYYTKVLYKLSSGETVTAEEYEERKIEHKKSVKAISKALPAAFPEIATLDIESKNELMAGFIPAELEIVKDRVTEDYVIMHYRCTADKVLEFEEWPSKFLPGVFVAGDTYYIKGQQYTRSFINQAKDAQRTVNYLASDIASRFKNSSRGQWLGTPGNVAGPGMADQWHNPEVQKGIMLANPDMTKGGDPMPTFLPPAEIPQSLFIHYQRATADVKEVLGMYDTQLGANGPEDSGVAIANRSIQGAGSTKVFFDNLDRAIEQLARASLDMFPAVYDDERTLTLTRANGDQYTTTINQKMPNGQIKNPIEKSDFDIELESGPSYKMQKLQAMDMMTKAISMAPQVFPLIGDLYFKNMDVQFSQQMSDRLKTIVPPDVLAKEAGQPPPPPKPNPQMMMMQKQMQLADAKLDEQKKELELKVERLELDKNKDQLAHMEMIYKFQQLQHEMRKSAADDDTENSKALLNYSSKISGVIANMQKDSKNAD